MNLLNNMVGLLLLAGFIWVFCGWVARIGSPNSFEAEARADRWAIRRDASPTERERMRQARRRRRRLF